jgi:hypothetical protein
MPSESALAGYSARTSPLSATNVCGTPRTWRESITTSQARSLRTRTVVRCRGHRRAESRRQGCSTTRPGRHQAVGRSAARESRTGADEAPRGRSSSSRALLGRRRLGTDARGVHEHLHAPDVRERDVHLHPAAVLRPGHRLLALPAEPVTVGCRVVQRRSTCSGLRTSSHSRHSSSDSGGSGSFHSRHCSICSSENRCSRIHATNSSDLGSSAPMAGRLDGAHVSGVAGERSGRRGVALGDERRASRHRARAR